jgi:hypothetical protein
VILADEYVDEEQLRAISLSIVLSAKERVESYEILLFHAFDCMAKVWGEGGHGDV